MVKAQTSIIARGRIAGINVSSGGVPKHPLERAFVTELGIQGDQQSDLQYHGGPNRAVCLFSWERIESLAQEGHPIAPGSVGENLTLAGIPWEVVIPGTQLRLGAEASIEVTGYTTPCTKMRSSFRESRIERISQKVFPGWSRVYARVLRPGAISVGDDALVLA